MKKKTKKTYQDSVVNTDNENESIGKLVSYRQIWMARNFVFLGELGGVNVISLPIDPLTPEWLYILAFSE